MIRNLTINDIDDILQLEKLCFSVPWSRNDFISELNNNLAEYLVIEEDQKVVGYLGIWHILDQGHITNIAIHPDYRHRGYAQLLLDTIVEKSVKKGCYSFTLEVRASNIPALKLYEKKGFIRAGIRPKYYQNIEDAVIMWMEIK